MMVTLLLFLIWPTPVQPHAFVVVTAEATPIEELSLFQLRQLYFGRLDRLNGTNLQPLQLTADSALRRVFEDTVLGDPATVEDYWLQQTLRGDARRPLTVADWPLVAAYVRRNPGYIGYVPHDRAADMRRQGIKVIRIHFPVDVRAD